MRLVKRTKNAVLRNFIAKIAQGEIGNRYGPRVALCIPSATPRFDVLAQDSITSRAEQLRKDTVEPPKVIGHGAEVERCGLVDIVA